MLIHRRDAAKRMFRFYRLRFQPILWGGTALAAATLAVSMGVATAGEISGPAIRDKPWVSAAGTTAPTRTRLQRRDRRGERTRAAHSGLPIG
jgi:hypothetical protein